MTDTSKCLWRELKWRIAGDALPEMAAAMLANKVTRKSYENGRYVVQESVGVTEAACQIVRNHLTNCGISADFFKLWAELAPANVGIACNVTVLVMECMVSKLNGAA